MIVSFWMVLCLHTAASTSLPPGEEMREVDSFNFVCRHQSGWDSVK